MRLYIGLLLLALIGCGKTIEKSSILEDSISVEARPTSAALITTDQLAGEYMIGDGISIITPNESGFEMRNAPTQEPYLLSFESIENDTTKVYATRDHMIIIKMYPGHERGIYYEDDEQWEMHRVKPTSIAHEESEEEETQRLLRERAAEDKLAYNSLNSYDGNYTLYTESEGSEGTLELKYKGDKVFDFKLKLKAADVCDGFVQGEIFMDRTQHGFFQPEGCMLHFNFMGNWGDSGFVVEIEQPEKCNLIQGECIFSGKYTTGTPTPQPGE